MKSKILEQSSSGIVRVIASGLGGVGKTCALRRRTTDSAVRQRFSGGILYIELRRGAGIADLICGIARVVRRTGGAKLSGTIRAQRDLTDATDKTAPWFNKHKLLFMVDDMWWG